MATIDARSGHRLVARKTWARTPILAGFCIAGNLLAAGAARAEDPAVVPLVSASDDDGVLPDNPLSAATLFKLMMSEIAAQRGAPDASYATELKLARDTRDPRIARRATEFAVQARQPAAAVEAARLWTELSPGSRVAADTYLTLLVLSSRFDDAEPLLTAKIAASQSKSQALIQTYALLAQGQNRDQTYALMRKLAGAYPSLPEAHMVVAQAAQAAGDKAGAVEEARTAVRLQPDSESATIMLAQFQQFDAPKETDAALSSFIARNPKSVPMRLAYARFLNGEKRYDESAAQLARLRKDAASDPETIYTIALLAYQSNRPQDAEAYFKHFIELRIPKKTNGTAIVVPAAAGDSDDGSDTADNAAGPGRGPDRAYLYLAQIAEDAKDFPRALDWLAKVAPGNDFATARIRHALILARQGKLDQARAELHALPSTTPAQATQLMLAEAQMLRDGDQNQAAFDFLGSAVEKTPNNPELLYDYGMTAEKIGRFDVLENAMRNVIRVRPDNAQAYNALGYTLADRNERLDEAKALIEKANALSPDDASILDSLGWVQYRLGNNGDALANLERAYKLRNDAEIAVHLGEVLWISGRSADAERAWREASAKEPQNVVLQQTLARFNVQMGKR
ncbi:MAG: tetratricopeptide repeat protein [Burkholderiaceae bacterium]